jgi:hypothetical protein
MTGSRLTIAEPEQTDTSKPSVILETLLNLFFGIMKKVKGRELSGKTVGPKSRSESSVLSQRVQMTFANCTQEEK